MINIELKDHTKTKEFFRKLHSRLEDLAFSIILNMPERFIPQWLMNCFTHYADKRIQELQQQIIKNRWTQDALERALADIHSQQRKEKAPADD